MLTYSVSNDLYHYLFRIIRIVQFLDCPVSLELIKILDFYSLFPKLVSEIRLTSETQKLRNVVKAVDDRYMHVENGKRQFLAMNGLYDQALNLSITLGVLKRIENKLSISSENSHKDLLNFIFANNLDSLQKKIITDLSKISLEGSNGLKDRTGLMEFRYDAE